MYLPCFWLRSLVGFLFLHWGSEGLSSTPRGKTLAHGPSACSVQEHRGPCEGLLLGLPFIGLCLFVSPSVLQLRPLVCPRTVLLSGIPDVLDEELMCEALEIHFQKPSKGGGEVEALAYVPPGQCAAAVFEGEAGGAASLPDAERPS